MLHYLEDHKSMKSSLLNNFGKVQYKKSMYRKSTYSIHPKLTHYNEIKRSVAFTIAAKNTLEIIQLKRQRISAITITEHRKRNGRRHYKNKKTSQINALAKLIF